MQNLFETARAAAAKKDHQTAEAAYRRILDSSPRDAQALYGLGDSLAAQSKNAEAHAAFVQTIEVCHELTREHPDSAEVWAGLGCALRRANRAREAIVALRRALDLRPDYHEAIADLAIALSIAQQYDEAIALSRSALRRWPDSYALRRNLASMLHNAGEHLECIEHFDRALAAVPDDADAYNDRGLAHAALGHFEQALSDYNAAIEIKGGSSPAWDNLLYSQHFIGTDPKQLLDEHARWQKAVETPPTARRRPHRNDRDPHRRVRIGYVSADFREHSAAFFLTPTLAAADHEKFEIFCYSCAPLADAFTARFREYADVWIDAAALDDDELVERIIADQIDILVDLSIHTRGNRLRVFATKPAPIQITWLGYCGTSGLGAMDYRITDSIVDPPGEGEKWSTEKLIRLPRTFCCYEPPPAPPVAPLPAMTNRHVTFGAFNTLSKTRPEMIELWCRILSEVPDARLLMLAKVFKEQAVARIISNQFAARGIDPARVELLASVPLKEYFNLFNRVDVALDTFPFNGHTTTCHALWMGVPTVSLTGEIPVSRVGASLLRHVGLSRLATNSPDDYVEAAVDLASRVGQLVSLRRDLRRRMEHSPLMNAPAFARDLQAAYRRVWTEWCAAGRDESP